MIEDLDMTASRRDDQAHGDYNRIGPGKQESANAQVMSTRVSP
jgi:hypothetical protein